jgi:D-arginine dehydrogenase
MQGFARIARGHGARLLTRAPVQAIAPASGGWRVSTGQGEIGARLLVNAAGAWADRIARMAGVAPLGLTPMRRSMARLPAPRGHDVSRWPFVLAAGELWYARPDAGKWLVSPADEDPTEPHDAWADDMVLAEGLDRYARAVSEPVTRVGTSWAGLRTFTPDRALAIGFAPGAPGFFWHAGQGGNGFQTAPAAGRLAADLIAGRQPDLDPDLIRALNPARFF